MVKCSRHDSSKAIAGEPYIKYLYVETCYLCVEVNCLYVKIGE